MLACRARLDVQCDSSSATAVMFKEPGWAEYSQWPRHNQGMESETPEIPNENEELFLDVCGRVGACFSFDVNDSSVTARMFKEPAGRELGYTIVSMPKPTREDACFSVIRQLLFPELAKTVGIPAASSVDELRLKLEVTGPS